MYLLEYFSFFLCLAYGSTHRICEHGGGGVRLISKPSQSCKGMSPPLNSPSTIMPDVDVTTLGVRSKFPEISSDFNSVHLVSSITKSCPSSSTNKVSSNFLSIVSECDSTATTSEKLTFLSFFHFL